MKTNDLFDILKTTVVTLEDGTREWYLNGKLHREDGPAIVYSDGDEEWWFNGKIHREGGPAIVYTSINVKEWYHNGVRRRAIDGDVLIEFDK